MHKQRHTRVCLRVLFVEEVQLGQRLCVVTELLELLALVAELLHSLLEKLVDDLLALLVCWVFLVGAAAGIRAQTLRSSF